jgi:hypothetical protein
MKRTTDGHPKLLELVDRIGLRMYPTSVSSDRYHAALISSATSSIPDANFVPPA